MTSIPQEGLRTTATTAAYYSPPDDLDLFSLKLDRRTGVVRAEVRGFWPLEVIDFYVREMSRLMTDGRASCGRARVIVDLSEFPVQRSDLADIFEKAWPSMFQANDLLAGIFSSSLVCGQWRRRIPFSGFKQFTSNDSAEAWIASG